MSPSEKPNSQPRKARKRRASRTSSDKWRASGKDTTMTHPPSGAKRDVGLVSNYHARVIIQSGRLPVRYVNFRADASLLALAHPDGTITVCDPEKRIETYRLSSAGGE